MAIINYTDQIKYTGKGYLDAKIMPVKTFEDLKAIPPTQRFEGLTIVVLNDGNPQDYWLIGGISNSCWKPKTSTNFNDLKLTLEEGFLKLQNADVQLGEAIDLNNFFPTTEQGIYIKNVDYSTVNENDEKGVFLCFTYSDETKKYLNMSQFLSNTYEAGSGIVIDNNIISIDAAIIGRIETIETKLININEELASKADISYVEQLEETLTSVSNAVEEEKTARQTADNKHDLDINDLKTRLSNLQINVESNKTDINANKIAIEALKTRVDSLTSNIEGATPDGETIGITNDERKALCVKILEKDGNLLKVDTNEGMVGLYATLPLFCEDEELNEE